MACLGKLCSLVKNESVEGSRAAKCGIIYCSKCFKVSTTSNSVACNGKKPCTELIPPNSIACNGNKSWLCCRPECILESLRGYGTCFLDISGQLCLRKQLQLVTCVANHLNWHDDANRVPKRIEDPDVCLLAASLSIYAHNRRREVKNKMAFLTENFDAIKSMRNHSFEPTDKPALGYLVIVARLMCLVFRPMEPKNFIESEQLCETLEGLRVLLETLFESDYRETENSLFPWYFEKHSKEDSKKFSEKFSRDLFSVTEENSLKDGVVIYSLSSTEWLEKMIVVLRCARLVEDFDGAALAASIIAHRLCGMWEKSPILGELERGRFSFWRISLVRSAKNFLEMAKGRFPTLAPPEKRMSFSSFSFSLYR